MIRRLLKTGGAHLLHATGADRLIAGCRGTNRTPLVLCYHRVVEDVRHHPWSAPAMLVGIRTLEQQLDWVGRRYRFASLDEIGRQVEMGRSSDRPLAAVTFDDGYEDVYRNAFPLLSRKGIPAAVFAVTDHVGTDRPLAHDALYAQLLHGRNRLGAPGLASLLGDVGVVPGGGPSDPGRSLADDRGVLELTERLLATSSRAEVRQLIEHLREHAPLPDETLGDHGSMTWEMLREMHRAGFTVGSHTRSHRVLPNESRADVVSELAGAKRALERNLGAAVYHLAYPDGQFSAAVVAAAATAGYRYAYTTCQCISSTRPLLTIPRRTFWERSCVGLSGTFSPAVASCQVAGVFDLVHPCPGARGREPQRRAREQGAPSQAATGSRAEEVA